MRVGAYFRSIVVWCIGSIGVVGCTGAGKSTCPTTVPERDEYREEVRTARFEVVGKTPLEIRRDSMAKIPGPRPIGHEVARTDSAFCTTWALDGGEHGCKLAAYRMVLQLTYVLPEWSPPANAALATRAWWDEDIALVTAHEHGHGVISREGAKAMYAAGLAIKSAPTCEELDAKLQRSYDEILEETRRRHAAFDEAEGTLHHL